MGYLVASLFILILTLLGKSFLGFSLILPLVLAGGFQLAPQESFLLAFATGVLVSLVDGSPLGRESLGFLLAVGFIQLYGRRFSSRHWAFTLVFAGLGSLIATLVTGKTLSVGKLAADIVLVMAFLPLVGWWRERFREGKIFLRV